MKRPSKKDIKAAVEKLKDTSSGAANTPTSTNAKLTPKMSSQRIRKQSSGS